MLIILIWKYRYKILALTDNYIIIISNLYFIKFIELILPIHFRIIITLHHTFTNSFICCPQLNFKIIRKLH